MSAARLDWRVATVVRVRDETPRARTLVLDIPHWPGHRAGQHVDVRLVAEDGYQAQRSYSIASAPEDASVELTVERIVGAEVSPYLCDVLRAGDGLEVRGPIGGYFVWDIAQRWAASARGRRLGHRAPHGDAPAPRARGRSRYGRASRCTLLYSVRTWQDVIYNGELGRLAECPEVRVTYTVTRHAPTGWQGYRRRIDRAMVEEVSWPASALPRAFVCGPTPLVESVATLLVELGHDPVRVRTERFGPTG